jgi:hypothetical protein
MVSVLFILVILAGSGARASGGELDEPGSDIRTVEPGSRITATRTESEPTSKSRLKPASVLVDFGAEQGELLRTERYNTWDNGDPAPDLRRDDVKFLTEQGLISEMVRVGFKVDELCDVEVNTCDFSPIAGWLDDISATTQSLVVHLTPEHIIHKKQPPSDARPLLQLAITELKQRFPKIRYIEATNEPDWEFHGKQIYASREPRLQPEDVYAYYVPFYHAVNAANKELPEAEHIKVGGPALTGMTETWMTTFLDGYAADSNPGKRLDFISYHGYGEFSDDFKEYRAYKADPSELSTQRARLDKWLKARQLSVDIPIFVTETGIYPGPSFDEPDPSKNDYIRQAAGLASLHYWWAGQAEIYPFNWVVRHATQGRKDQLITHSPEGPLTDTLSPYGNMLLMQSRMKNTRVNTTSDALNNGQGVYAVASKDASGVSVMVWNYQHVNNGMFRATIEMSRLPPALGRTNTRQTLYRIDKDTSNFWANPEAASLQRVDERSINPGDNHSVTIDLTPNAVYLILLEPMDGA